MKYSTKFLLLLCASAFITGVLFGLSKFILAGFMLVISICSIIGYVVSKTEDL